MVGVSCAAGDQFETGGRIVESAHQRAKQILETNRELLDSISVLLLKRETIEKEEFETIMGPKKLAA